MWIIFTNWLQKFFINTFFDYSIMKISRFFKFLYQNENIYWYSRIIFFVCDRYYCKRYNENIISIFYQKFELYFDYKTFVQNISFWHNLFYIIHNSLCDFEIRRRYRKNNQKFWKRYCKKYVSRYSHATTIDYIFQ